MGEGSVRGEGEQSKGMGAGGEGWALRGEC